MRSGQRRLSSLINPFLERHWKLARALLYLLAGIGAWSARFFPDDAFIGYRYASNLASGYGMVYNPGERIEGYTNFLWTLIHAVPHVFGWSPIFFSSVLGMAVLAVVLGFSLDFFQKIFRSKALAYMACLFMVGNATFLGYAAGGMETMLQACLVLVFAWLLLPDREQGRHRREIFAGTVAALAIMTRLDSSLLVGCLGVAYLVSAYGRLARWRGFIGSGLRLAVPAIIFVLPWLIWKNHYYGSVIPNTFFAKTGSSFPVTVGYGAFYSACFFLSYGAFLLFPRLLEFGKDFLELPAAKALLAAVIVWIAYICVIGGDFMEFRFFVPVIPFLSMLAAFLLDRYYSAWKQALVIAVLLSLSAAHLFIRNPLPYPYPVWTFKELNLCPNGIRESAWHSIGAMLAGSFPGDLGDASRPKIAVMPAGALPYVSRLQTVDMLGLNDRWIAENGDAFGLYYPGHLRMAPVDYLVDREVNLVFGLPFSSHDDTRRSSYRLSELAEFYFISDLNRLPPSSKAVEIPYFNGLNWVAIYLQPNPKIDKAIMEYGWKVFDIERVCDRNDLGAFVSFVGTETCPRPTVQSQ